MKKLAAYLAPKTLSSSLWHEPNEALETRCNPRLAYGLALLSSALVFAIMSAEFLGGTHRLDRILLFGLSEPLYAVGHGSTWLTHAASYVTRLGSPEVAALVTALAIGLLCLARRWRSAIYVAITVSTGTVLAFLLKIGFGELRPHHLITDGQAVVLNTTFPSGHATLAALVFFSLAMAAAQEAKGGHRRWARICAFSLAASVTAAVGATRVYLGVHWPSDVIAGWFLGVTWSAVCRLGVTRMWNATRAFGCVS